MWVRVSVVELTDATKNSISQAKSNTSTQLYWVDCINLDIDIINTMVTVGLGSVLGW